MGCNCGGSGGFNVGGSEGGVGPGKWTGPERRAQQAPEKGKTTPRKAASKKPTK